MENRSYISKNGIISFLNRFFLRLRSWPDFVWSLFSPRLAILFDHMYPLSPVHFSLASSFFFLFSTFVLFFLFLYYMALQTPKSSLSRFYLSSKHIVLPHATYFNHPIERLLYTQHVHQLLAVLRSNSFTSHIARKQMYKYSAYYF